MVLHGLGTSPWTARARWALDHHGLSYRYREHVPFLEELLLRSRAGSLLRPATVPLLVDGATRVMSSGEIARYAETNGRGAPLFPTGGDDVIARVEALSDALLHEARGRVLARVGASAEARREAVPRGMPSFTAPTIRLVTAFMAKKYDTGKTSDDAAAERMRPILEELRERLSGRDTFLEGLTYADVTCATALHALTPPAAPHCTWGPGMREAWTHAALAEAFPDLIRYRDGVFARRAQPA